MPDRNMTMACMRWLAAHEAFHEGGMDYMDAYSEADQNLLVAFAEGWSPDQRTFDHAYLALRDTLVKQHGSSPLKIQGLCIL